VSKKKNNKRIEGPRPDLQVSLQVPKSMSIAPNTNQAKALSTKPSRSHEGPILKHNLCTTLHAEPHRIYEEDPMRVAWFLTMRVIKTVKKNDANPYTYTTSYSISFHPVLWKT
jgi:hypothetical protein